jgi:prepilin-type N-terminal cleavage/methylation domain-containing protein
MNASGVRFCKAFTVLEMLVVVTMLALLAGLTLTSLARTSDEAIKDRAVTGLATRLLTVRAEAMESGLSKHATVSIGEEGELTMRTDDDTPLRAWPIGDLSESGGPGAIRFALDGREPTASATITFIPVGRASSRRLEAVSSETGGTIFTIMFDPISGEPRLEDRTRSMQGGDP